MFFALFLLSVSATASTELQPAAATDWPAWRGAANDGVAQGSPPIEFGEDANVRWKSPLPGRGLSTPVIIGDRVFVTSAVSAPADSSATPSAEARGGREPDPVTETDFLVLAFDRTDGSVLWEAIARTQVPHQGTHRDGSFAAPSVATDGEHLFVSFGSYGIYAYDLEGEPVWETDLGDMDVRNAFGEGSSPVVHGDSLIVLWDHEGDSFLAALDKNTGKERWRTERHFGTNWSTPLIVETDAGTQIVVASSTTVAYDLETGKAVWTCGTQPEVAAAPEGERGGRSRTGGIIATPVLSDGVLIYGTGTRRGGSIWALQLDKAAGHAVHESEALMWTNDRDAPRIPSPIVHDGILYALKSTSGILSALDLRSGEPVYESTRLEGVGDVWASPVIADNRLYVLGRDGTVEVLATGPEFRTLAVNHLEDTFDASPAVSGDALFLRGREHLYCIAKTD